MKRNLLTIFMAFTAVVANAQWIQQSVTLPYEGYINDIRIVDATTVWGNTWDAVTHSVPYTQDFVRTTDGGNTWDFGSVGAPSQYVISNIWPVDGDTCYVAMFDSTGAGGAVYKTTDAGSTWGQVGANMFQAATSFANIVYFWDAQNGIAIGDPIGNPLKYEIWLTNDYGNTWTQVPPANIPGLTNNAEYGITNLFDAIDGRIWFGTTYGDMYRSFDGGNTWSKSASGFPAYSPAGRQDISNIAFSDSLNGLITQVNATSVLLRGTNDGGASWFVVGQSGTVFSGDITGVPGKPNAYVTAGSNGTFGFGTSFTLDGGYNWLELDNGVSHTAIDFKDSVTGWTGEYIPVGTFGGAYHFDGALAAISCNNPTINPGTSTVNDSTVCFGDTLVVTTTGVVAPTEGGTHGFSILVSTADISQNNDPLSDLSIIAGGTGVITGTPPPTVLVNDQGIFPAGIYYFTPLVYGNASGTGNVTGLTLDINCTYTGNSVYVNLLDIGDPQCTVGITDLTNTSFSVNAYLTSTGMLNLRIRATKNDANSPVEIFDMTGRKVYSNKHAVVSGLNEISIPVDHLNAGTYILKTESGGAVAATRIIKL